MTSAAPALNTRDRILDAAELLFAQKGLAGTAVRDIAARVDLNPASLYNHFPSKLALYEAVLDRSLQPLLDLLQEATREPTGGDRVIELLMSHLEQNPQLARLIHHEAVTGGVHLARLARVWLKPLVSEALAILRGTGHRWDWEEEDYPLLIAAWIHMIFGHFALAPLFSEVLGEDTLSPEAIARQSRFLRKLTLRMLGEDVPDRSAR